MEYTPDNIQNLGPNDIFVFGSNQFGQHDGGAALIAKNLYGAITGVPMGLADQSYGIITASYTATPITTDFIREQIAALYGFARTRPDLKFLVTKIGTGIAGFTMATITDLFISQEYNRPKNVILPKEFHQQ